MSKDRPVTAKAPDASKTAHKKRVYKAMPPGETLKGKPGNKRAYVSAGPYRDMPVEEVRVMEQLGHKPGYGTVGAHVRAGQAGKANPNAPLTIQTRRQNSVSGGGYRTPATRAKGKK